LINNIDLSSWGEWTPIGEGYINYINYFESFDGTFDGNNFTISNLKLTGNQIAADGMDGSLGLFGLARDCTISNLHLNTNININIADVKSYYGDNIIGILPINIVNIGGIAGYINKGIVNNCSFSGDIKVLLPKQIGQELDIVRVGGIAGTHYESTISNCKNYANIEVTSKKPSVGGICGYGWNPNIISNCYNYGDIKATSYLGSAYAGGIAGEVSHSHISEYCYNCGSISAYTFSHFSDVFAGGIIGIGCYITKSVNIGNVFARAEENIGIQCGGIAGINGTPIKCYNLSSSISYEKLYAKEELHDLISHFVGAGRIIGSKVYPKEVHDNYSIGSTLVNGVIPTEDIGKNLRNGQTATLQEIKAMMAADGMDVGFVDENYKGDLSGQPTTPQTQTNSKGLLVDITGEKSFLTHKLTDTTYEEETLDVKVNVTSYNLINPYNYKLSDAEKENLKIKNVVLYITYPNNVSVEAVDKSIPLGILINGANIKNTNFFNLGDLDYFGTTSIDLRFTFNPTQDAGSYDIKVHVTAKDIANNITEKNTTYTITYESYETKPISVVKRSTSNDNFVKAAYDWQNKLDNYFDALKKLADAENKSISKTKEKPIQVGIESLKQRVDLISGENMFLKEGTPLYDEIKTYCYRALFEYLSKETYDKLKLSEIDTSRNEIEVGNSIVKSIINGMSSEEASYTYDKYVVKITVNKYKWFKDAEAFMGNIVCTNRQSNVEYKMEFVSSLQQTQAAIQAYINELVKLGSNAYDSATKAVLQELVNITGLNDWLTKSFKNTLSKYKQILINKGYGDIDALLGGIHNYYNYVKSINSIASETNLFDFASKIIGVSDKFDLSLDAPNASLFDNVANAAFYKVYYTAFNQLIKANNDLVTASTQFNTERSKAWKELKSQKAETVNKSFQKGIEPPYKPGTSTTIIKLTQKSKVGDFVRVYDKVDSGQEGHWLMRADDIAGLTPRQIQNKFALPTIPTYVTDVIFDEGTQLRMGIANGLFGSEGGGTQFDTMGKNVGQFINERLLR